MKYEDPGRSFPMVTGLLFGTVVGAALAIMVSPGRIDVAGRARRSMARGRRRLSR